MVKIRLRRMGTTNSPYFRVVVSDGRSTPKAAAVEEIGIYDPRRKPAEVKIDRDRVKFWVDRGAQVSETVRTLLARA